MRHSSIPLLVVARPRVGSRQQPQELGEFLADRLRVRSAMPPLERLPAPLLAFGHAPFAAQLGIGERVQEVGAGANKDVEVAGIVLAVLEGLETIGDQGFVDGSPVAESLLEEQAVPAQPRDLAHDRGGGDRQLAGDLPETRASHRAQKDRGEQIRPFEPVGGLEGLVAE